MDLELEPSALGAPLARGGEGTVHRLADGHHVAKMYHHPELVDFFRVRRLIELRESLPAVTRKLLDGFCAWPLGIVRSGGRESGVAMKVVPDEYYMEVPGEEGQSRRITRELQHLIVEGFLARRDFYDPNIAERVDLIGSFAFDLAVLHGLGVVVGDISMKNLLWTLRPSPAVFMLDVDSFTFAGWRGSESTAETPGWESPQELDPPSVLTDAYKLALAGQRIFEQRHSAPLDPSGIAIHGDTELELTIRSMIDAARQHDPVDARRWAFVCGQVDPFTVVPGYVGGWIDAALMVGDWERALRLGAIMDARWPRLEIARQHLAALD